MINQTPESKQHLVDKILEHIPINSEVAVELPSKGKIYSSIDPTKPVTIRPMNFEDEKTIASQKGKGDPISIILSRCVSNLNVEELIAADKLFLVMKLREISYGDDYGCNLTCTNCKTPNSATIKLSELPVEYATDEFTDPVEVMLTGIKKKAKIRLIRSKDESLFKDPATSMNQLWRFVQEIDGHSDKPVISAVIEKLPSKDIKKIINSMRTTIGIDTKIAFNCASCSTNNLVELPITSDFFEES
jgi:hypothetical protein